MILFRRSILAIIFLLSSFVFASSQETKEQAIALYTTGNYNEAYEKLSSLSTDEKDENVFLLLSNISQENGKDNLAIQYLNKALDKNNTFYKAYYNLGCIFAKKKSYLLASNNFEFTIKYNKTFAPAYYNLACCQMMLKNYAQAKKNLIKALQFEPNNKDYLYNLILCYKELNQNKQAKKILKTYNSLS